MVYSCGGLRAVSDIYLVRHSPRGNVMELYIFERNNIMILCTYLPAVVVGESVRPIVPGGLQKMEYTSEKVQLAMKCDWSLFMKINTPLQQLSFPPCCSTWIHTSHLEDKQLCGI